MILRPSRLFDLDTFFDDWFYTPSIIKSDFTLPKMDIKEMDDHYEVIVDVPGFEKEDIDIEVHKDVLTIRSEHETKTEEKDDDGNYICRERSYRNFTRRIRLPDDVKGDDIKASMDKGVLKLELSKTEPEPKKKIDIKETKEIEEKIEPKVEEKEVKEE
jgi:HSP20 family protein